MNESKYEAGRNLFFHLPMCFSTNNFGPYRQLFTINKKFNIHNNRKRCRPKAFAYYAYYMCLSNKRHFKCKQRQDSNLQSTNQSIRTNHMT